MNYNSFIIDFNSLEKSEKLKKRLLFWVFVFLTFHHVFFFLYLFKSNKAQSLAEGMSAIFDILGLAFLKFNHKIVFPTALLAVYGFVSISIGVWENGGVGSSEIGWYIVTIFSITLVLDRQVGIGLYFFSFIMILLVGFLQYLELHDFTQKAIDYGKDFAIINCTSLFIIIGFIIRFIFTSDNINRIWKKEKEEKIELLEIEKTNQLIQDKINSLNFTKQLLETTELERKRIATDLHDSISHELLNLKSIFKQDIGVVNAKIDSIINDIRGISRNLHPVMFDKIGLVPNIEQLVERIQTQSDFLVNTEINYKGTLTSAEELQIYRIIQEALTNIVKYAKAHAAKITISDSNGLVAIEIKDNGKGFNVKETLNSGKAFGLHNILERSRAIAGEAQIDSTDNGTNIHIKILKKA